MGYKKQFIKFMEENRAFKEWCKEVETDESRVDRALDYMNNKFNAPQVLDDGIIFFYAESDRKGFWNNLNFKWKEYLDERPTI